MGVEGRGRSEGGQEAVRKDIWEQVVDLVLEGQQPQVVLPPGARVVVPKGRRGRRRTRPEGAHGHWGWVMMTPAGYAMRCRAPGCLRTVRKHEATLVCSSECKTALEDYCETTLAVLQGRMGAENYPPAWRGCRGSKVRKK